MNIRSCRTLCQVLSAIWQDLAEEFNKKDDQEVSIAKFNCEIESAFCSGIQLNILLESKTKIRFFCKYMCIF